MRIAVFLLAVLVFGSVVRADSETQENLRRRLAESKAPRILFVGNSYSFKVPGAFAALARKAGHPVEVEQVTKGGWTLKKHAAAKETLEKIRSGNWDVVVLQEQSQMPAFQRGQREKEMIPHAVALAAEARKAGAVPVFFLTWGRRDGDAKNAKTYPDDTFAKMQARLTTGYREAAAESGQALIVPVGPAWAGEVEAGRY